MASIRQAFEDDQQQMQSTIRHEREMREKALKENTELTKERADLLSQLRRCESQLSQHQQELSTAKRSESSQREIEEVK